MFERVSLHGGASQGKDANCLKVGVESLESWIR